MSDGKGLGGKNILIDKLIDKFTTYYRNAVREYKSYVSKMRKAMWTIYCHNRSSNDNPVLHLAPSVAERVCAQTGRREVLGSILCRACRPSRSEFSVVFFETRVNMA